MSPYARLWVDLLNRDAMRALEDWQLDVVQAQFIDAQTCFARRDFMVSHGASIKIHQQEPVVPLSDRASIVASACKVLLAHGRRPLVSCFWFPSVFADMQMRPPHQEAA